MYHTLINIKINCDKKQINTTLLTKEENYRKMTRIFMRTLQRAMVKKIELAIDSKL